MRRNLSMMAPRPSTEIPAGLLAVGEQVSACIDSLLEAELGRWSRVDPDLAAPIDSLAALVRAGGKRLRPAFCHWAYVGAGGDPADKAVVHAGAALELLHTFALVHDDVMDGSLTRRGLPAVHRQFMATQERNGWVGESRRFGEGAAILIGDFAFVWSDLLLGDVTPSVRAVFDELRIELCVGQYLDLAAAARGANDLERAARIERYKSGKYTVERPLHLGAALAGRFDELAPHFSAFGVPLGEAFQLRDDLLAIFGDAETIGKPVGDDLREGKRTPLIAMAAERASGAEQALIARLGAPDLSDDEVQALTDLLDRCGARAAIEARIDTLVEESLAALAAAPITDEARTALTELGEYVAWRDR